MQNHTTPQDVVAALQSALDNALANAPDVAFDPAFDTAAVADHLADIAALRQLLSPVGSTGWVNIQSYL